MNPNAPVFVPGYTYTYPVYYAQPYAQPYYQVYPIDPYYWCNVQTVPIAQPTGLTESQIIANETLEYLSQQKEWTPLWSDLFAAAQKETEEKDLQKFFEMEARRKQRNDYVCQLRCLIHPIPEKPVMVDVSLIEENAQSFWS